MTKIALLSERLHRALLLGPRKGEDLRNELGGISQPEFSRLVHANPGRLEILGQRKAAIYVATRSIRDLGARIPLFRVTQEGQCESLGDLVSFYPKGFAFVRQPNSQAPKLFEGIPYFLSDLRPQGFLGRSFARRFPDLRLPGRITDWSEDDALVAIARRGEEAPGDLIVGKESFERFHARKYPHSPIESHPAFQDEETSLSARYAAAADRAIEGDAIGSSAAGEQPKFTAELEGTTGIRHVIVKFSPTVDVPHGRRWADLLVAESIALECIASEAGIPTARSRIVAGRWEGERVFLEVERFDRVGKWGRKGVISLAAWDDEHFGKRDDWTSASGRMLKERMISPEDARSIRFLDAFGGLIANTDRHFGNLSFFWDFGSDTLRLAPLYDMLPMLYAPASDGQVLARKFSPAPPKPESLDEWSRALPLAREYWRKVSVDARVSAGFRGIAADNARAL